MPCQNTNRFQDELIEGCQAFGGKAEECTEIVMSLDGALSVAKQINEDLRQEKAVLEQNLDQAKEEIVELKSQIAALEDNLSK